ncbi:MAG: hypothetical protein ACO23H_16910 [Alphaproteobacteria bacterium]
MQEKVTGLDWRDFVGINTGISSLIKDYQRLIDNGSTIADYWAGEIVKLKATQKKIAQNRSIER